MTLQCHVNPDTDMVKYVTSRVSFLRLPVFTTRERNAWSLVSMGNELFSSELFSCVSSLKLDVDQVKIRMVYDNSSGSCEWMCGVDLHHQSSHSPPLLFFPLFLHPLLPPSPLFSSSRWRGISTRLSAHLHPRRGQKASPRDSLIRVTGEPLEAACLPRSPLPTHKDDTCRRPPP